MPKRMLIDAGHPEETRVVVLDGQKVEEFDFEAASKRPLKGNIYLAKVTRVEPSLQAAFVEYGGNRQGFLAFAEIHPDYYQIPYEDRQALLAEQEAEAKRRQEDDIESFEITSEPKPEIGEDEDETGSDAETASTEGDEQPYGEATPNQEAAREELFAQNEDGDAGEMAEDGQPDHDEAHDHADHDHEGHDHDALDHDAPEQDEDDDQPVLEADGEQQDSEDAGEDAASAAEYFAGTDLSGADLSGGDAAVETADGEQPAQAHQAKRPSQRFLRKKHYKIQEVIKRRQIILVQVVKEERGNKGAALTTYLSLAGRYCVLMPNTPRGGGISRKITNMSDRKRLKSAAQALELPEGMGLIIRTAGESKTKLEIRRDYEYLLRLWDTIRENTLGSNAPACVYEEGDLIKRVIRDLYTANVEDIQVEGERGYENARDFMAMLMPSHVKNVKLYSDPVPLFQRNHIEAQLDSMFTPTVTLKSGGYIVINQTEALVSIDVNSGRATREHNIEETARKTNLEAADEVGRQLRLRDLAGLIVIDFIDMEDGRNDREVEKRMHNAVKNDRARVQVGKISQFGLLEMSRQRLRAGVVAGSTVVCPHCAGQGIVRSVESNALRVLRAVEEEAMKRRSAHLNVSVSADIAIYILNQKRRELSRIENDYGVTIGFVPTHEALAGHFEIERVGQRNAEERPRLAPAVSIEAGFGGTPISEEAEPESEADEEDETDEEEAEETVASSDDEQSSEQSREANGDVRRKRRRRRRGGRGRGEPGERSSERPQVAAQETAILDPGADSFSTNENGEGIASGEASDGEQPSGTETPAEGEARRRRRRRRGRRGRRDGEPVQGQPELADGEQDPDNQQESAPVAAAPAPAAPSYNPSLDRFGIVEEVDTTPSLETRRPQPNTESSPVWNLTPTVDTIPDTTPVDDKASSPPRKGWWQRTFKTED